MSTTVKQSTQSRVVNVRDLSERDYQKMYSILCEHFSNVDRNVFESDLREKNWVIQVEDSDGNIQGFSTLQRMTLEHNGGVVHAFFSGDTVLSQAFMGDASWIPVWTRHVFFEAARMAPDQCYWMLLTATHKTYRILPSCFKEFIPRPDQPSQPLLKDLLARFVRQKFPHEFKEETGLVVLAKTIPYRHSQQVEREADSGEHRNATRYFKKVNPNFLRGDFLCCFTEISPSNLNSLGLRILKPQAALDTTTAA